MGQNTISPLFSSSIYLFIFLFSFLAARAKNVLRSHQRLEPSQRELRRRFRRLRRRRGGTRTRAHARAAPPGLVSSSSSRSSRSFNIAVAAVQLRCDWLIPARAPLCVCVCARAHHLQQTEEEKSLKRFQAKSLRLKSPKLSFLLTAQMHSGKFRSRGCAPPLPLRRFYPDKGESGVFRLLFSPFSLLFRVKVSDGLRLSPELQPRKRPWPRPPPPARARAHKRLCKHDRRVSLFAVAANP